MALLAVFVTLRPPSYHDFGQYYLASQIACQGVWQDLYPIPKDDSIANAGGRADSTMRLRYAELASEHGVGDVNRFIQTPPVALLLVPMSFLNAHWAYIVWVILMSACCWGLAVQAGWIYNHLSGRADRVPGILALLIVASPLVYRTIRTTQISPLIALAIGWAAITLIKNRPFQSSIAVVFGSLIKYAAGILIVLMVTRAKWRMLLWVMCLSTLALVMTVSITGLEPFHVFLGEIAPTLSRSHAWRGNQSLSGFLLHASPNLDSQWIAIASRSIGTVLFALITIMSWWRYRSSTETSASLAAASLALIACWAIASPIFWEHYYVYFIPFWGYLFYEAKHHRLLALAVILATASTWLPLAVVSGIQLPVVLRFHMFFGACIMMAVSVSRLMAPHAATDGAFEDLSSKADLATP